MTLNEFEYNFQKLVGKWKQNYQENHTREPDNWPLDVEFAGLYEDFSVWMELTGENL